MTDKFPQKLNSWQCWPLLRVYVENPPSPSNSPLINAGCSVGSIVGTVTVKLLLGVIPNLTKSVTICLLPSANRL